MKKEVRKLAKDENEKIVAGLDIGTTKICCIIGEINNNGSISVIGIGNTVSRGLRKGIVVNIESTVESIKKAVDDACRMSGVEIGSVYAGIAGGHIKGINTEAVVAVSSKNKEVTKLDVNRVIEAIKTTSVPLDREVIHIIPQEFIVDDQNGIKDPVGMYGTRLKARVHVVTANVSRAQDLVRSVEKAGFYVEDIVLQPFASSESVLTSDEKELGVVLIDIGGGTTDIIVFIEGGVRHTAVISVGGIQVTNDIAIGLRAPIEQSEEIKKNYGCAFAPIVNEDEEIKVKLIGGRPERIIPRRIVAEIIQPRLEEIFEFVNQELKSSGVEGNVPAGVVVTGGSSLISGIEEVVEKVLKLPVRVGYPTGISGLVEVVNSPIYATAVGLMLYGAKSRSQGRSGLRASGGNLFDRVLNKMKTWFEEFF
ncbi:MAG: cell division protein FtsA [Candidatus Firestonebacteria bacterium]